MNQFTIPQFLDVEDKIFGPITTRQFGILLAAVGPILLAYKLADRAMFLAVAVIVGTSAIILAFVKINGQPFHFFLLNIFANVKRPSRRVWSKNYTDSELKQFIKDRVETKPAEDEKKEERRAIDNTKIRDLSLLVNTGGYYKPE